MLSSTEIVELIEADDLYQFVVSLTPERRRRYITMSRGVLMKFKLLVLVVLGRIKFRDVLTFTFIRSTFQLISLDYTKMDRSLRRIIDALHSGKAQCTVEAETLKGRHCGEYYLCFDVGDRRIDKLVLYDIDELERFLDGGAVGAKAFSSSDLFSTIDHEQFAFVTFLRFIPRDLVRIDEKVETQRIEHKNKQPDNILDELLGDET